MAGDRTRIADQVWAEFRAEEEQLLRELMARHALRMAEQQERERREQLLTTILWLSLAAGALGCSALAAIALRWLG